MDRAALAARLMYSPPIEDPTGLLAEPVYRVIVCESVLREIIAALLNEPLPLSKGGH